MAYRADASELATEVRNPETFGLPEDVANQFADAIVDVLGEDDDGNPETPNTVNSETFDLGQIVNLEIGNDGDGNPITVADLLGSGDATVTTSGQSIFINSSATGNTSFEINLADGNIAFGQLGSGDNTLTIVPIEGTGSQTLADGTFATLFRGGDGDDTMTGADQADQLYGESGDDVISGGGGNDLLSGGSGSDSIDGGSGFDQVTFDVALADVTLDNDGGLIVTNGDDVDTHTGVEFVSFADDGVVLGLGNQDQGDVARLYEIVLERSADYEGIQFWLGVLEGGASLDQISEAFVSSEEFGTILDSPTNEQFVQQLYVQGLDRAGDDAGVGFWTELLEDGSITRPELVSLFAESQEAVDLYTNIQIIDDFDL